MSAPVTLRPASPSTGGLLLFPLRVALGLFVLWQVVFLIGYNVLDVASPTRKHLKKQREAWLQQQEKSKDEKAEHDGKQWERVIHLPLVGELIQEWVEKEDSALGRTLSKADKVID